MTTHIDSIIPSGLTGDDSSADRRQVEANEAAEGLISRYVDPAGFGPNYVQHGDLTGLVAWRAEHAQVEIPAHRKLTVAQSTQAWLKECSIDRNELTGTQIGRVVLSSQPGSWTDMDVPHICFTTIPDDEIGEAVSTLGSGAQAMAVFFSPKHANPRVRVVNKTQLRVTQVEDLAFSVDRRPKNTRVLDKLTGSVVVIGDDVDHENGTGRANHRYLIEQFVEDDDHGLVMHVTPWVPAWYQNRDTVFQDRLDYPESYEDGAKVYPTELRPNEYAESAYLGIVATFGSVDEAVEAFNDLRQAVRTFDRPSLDSAYEPDVFEVADRRDNQA